jgi:hypothetical protein
MALWRRRVMHAGWRGGCPATPGAGGNSAGECPARFRRPELQCLITPRMAAVCGTAPTGLKRGADAVFPARVRLGLTVGAANAGAGPFG